MCLLATYSNVQQGSRLSGHSFGHHSDTTNIRRSKRYVKDFFSPEQVQVTNKNPRRGIRGSEESASSLLRCHRGWQVDYSGLLWTLSSTFFTLCQGIEITYFILLHRLDLYLYLTHLPAAGLVLCPTLDQHADPGVQYPPDVVVILDLVVPGADVRAAGALNANDLAFFDAQYVDEPEQILPDLGEWVPMFYHLAEVAALTHELQR